MADHIADFHIHSKYSHDSLASPESIVKRASKIGLTVIAVTDHNTIKGSIEANRFGERYGVYVIHGAEFSTTCGDILALNINENIYSKDWREVIDAIRDQGGRVVLPHPYNNHREIDDIAKEVDFIEIWNSRCTKEENSKAKHLAAELNKKVMVNSDAHCISQIGSVKCRIDPGTWELKTIICNNYTPRWKMYKCHTLARLRRGNIRGLIQDGKLALQSKRGAP